MSWEGEAGSARPLQVLILGLRFRKRIRITMLLGEDAIRGTVMLRIVSDHARIVSDDASIVCE